MPPAGAAVAAVAGAVAGAATAVGAAIGGAAAAVGLGGALAGAVAWATSTAGILTLGSLAASTILSRISKGQGRDQGVFLTPQARSDAPYTLIVGKRAVAGSFVDRYASGKKNRKHTTIYAIADHQCHGLTQIWADGRQVYSGSLSHGVRTELTAFRNEDSQPQCYVTWYDGRAGQTADAQLVSDSGGAWTSSHVGYATAYIAVETIYDGTVLPSSNIGWRFEVEGALLYDRRLDSTAGGSGSHRFSDSTTWAYTDNAAVAEDHFKLGYYVAGIKRFGMGLPMALVDYDDFAAKADLCDEDVDLEVGTQKRYRFNGIILSEDVHQRVMDRFAIQMGGEVADRLGFTTIVPGEAKTPILTLTDGDLIDPNAHGYDEKRGYDELFNAVRGRYADPAQLYEWVDYPAVTNDDWVAEDGAAGEKFQPLDFEDEVDVHRAQRLATLVAQRARRQAQLSEGYRYRAMELEEGDWFNRESDVYGFPDGKLFEAIKVVRNWDLGCAFIVAREVDPDDHAWVAEQAIDPPAPPSLPVDLGIDAIDAPDTDATGFTWTDGNSQEPAIRVVVTDLDDRTSAIEVEVQATDGAGGWKSDKRVFPLGFALEDIGGGEEGFVGRGIVRSAIDAGVQYRVRSRSKVGLRVGPWGGYDLTTTPGDYKVPAAALADDAPPESILQGKIDDAAASALADKAAAEAAAADSEAAKLAAQAAKTASELARDNAQTYASNASGSATASAGSASTATTQASAAGASASAASASQVAAASSASSASGSASTAAAAATNSAAYRDTASGYATAASGSASSASGSAATATAQATIAQQSAELSASFSQGVNWLTNPVFAKWPTGQGRPTGWEGFGTPANILKSSTYQFTPGLDTVQLVTSAGVNSGIQCRSATAYFGEYGVTPAVKCPDWVVVEVTMLRYAGTDESAGILLQPIDSGGTVLSNTVRKTFTEIATEMGLPSNQTPYRQWVTVRTLLDLSAYASSAVDFAFYLMGNWNAFGGSQPAKYTFFGGARLRAATGDEIAMGKPMASGATVRSQMTAAVNSGRAIAVLDQMVAASGGNPAQMRLMSADGLSLIDLVSDVLRFLLPGNSTPQEIFRASTYGIEAKRPIISYSGARMGVMAPAFGASSDLFLWSGGTRALSSCTRNNAAVAITMDGEFWVNGARVGNADIEQSGSGTTSSNSQTVTISAVHATQGNAIEVSAAVSYSASTWTSGVPSPNPTSYTFTCSAQFQRSVNGGAWTNIGSAKTLNGGGAKFSPAPETVTMNISEGMSDGDATSYTGTNGQNINFRVVFTMSGRQAPGSWTGEIHTREVT